MIRGITENMYNVRMVPVLWHNYFIKLGFKSKRNGELYTNRAADIHYPVAGPVPS